MYYWYLFAMLFLIFHIFILDYYYFLNFAIDKIGIILIKKVISLKYFLLSNIDPCLAEYEKQCSIPFYTVSLMILLHCFLDSSITCENLHIIRIFSQFFSQKLSIVLDLLRDLFCVVI